MKTPIIADEIRDNMPAQQISSTKLRKLASRFPRVGDLPLSPSSCFNLSQ